LQGLTMWLGGGFKSGVFISQFSRPMIFLNQEETLKSILILQVPLPFYTLDVAFGHAVRVEP
jgi:hypothetical protein